MVLDQRSLVVAHPLQCHNEPLGILSPRRYSFHAPPERASRRGQESTHAKPRIRSRMFGCDRGISGVISDARRSPAADEDVQSTPVVHPLNIRLAHTPRLFGSTTPPTYQGPRPGCDPRSETGSSVVIVHRLTSLDAHGRRPVEVECFLHNGHPEPLWQTSINLTREPSRSANFTSFRRVIHTLYKT